MTQTNLRIKWFFNNFYTNQTGTKFCFHHCLSYRCDFEALVAEVDRILRPEGKLIVRDKVETINELQTMLNTMHWEVRLTYSKDREGLLCVQKSLWRPKEVETITYAIAS